MYQCIIPPRIFLSIGVGLLIFSLVLGWISFSVPDWLQFYESNALKDLPSRNSSTDDNLTDLKKFGLWYKCIFVTKSNDFTCTLWKNDAPSKKRVSCSNCLSTRVFSLIRFCSSGSSIDTIWFIIGMFIIFISDYWFYVQKGFYYYCIVFGIIRIFRL